MFSELPVSVRAQLSQKGDPVRIGYDVRFSTPQQHILDVQMWIEHRGDSPIEIAFPVWTPGSYMIREYARNVERLCAHWQDLRQAASIDPANRLRSIPVTKVSKNRWRILCLPDFEHGMVCVQYQLYCREMSVRTNWIERDFAFVTGAAAFPWVIESEREPLLVQLHLPSRWQAATSLPELERCESKFIFVAENYDQLVDSPIVCGNLKVREFSANGKSHRLVMVGDGDLWDLERAALDTQKLVLAQQSFWPETPYDNYCFLNLLTESGGGLEHDNSCVLMASRWTMRKRETYLNWLSLVSHEFFHTWNVRRLRPRALNRYDYESEQYIRELWVSEGITSYYDDLFVARAGLCSSDEYLQRLSKSIFDVQSSPGRLVQSLENSSWDAWIKHYRPDENSGNSRISYYLKGALVAWLLDAQIRRATNNKHSLDDVMRLMWSRFRFVGFTLEQFDELVAEIAGQEVQQWLADQIHSATELEYSHALDWYGLRFKVVAQTDSQLPTTSQWTGIETSMIDGRLVARRVVRGSPADQAGVNVDDELIALGGYRISAADWADRFAMLNSNSALELIVARRGKLTTLEFGPTSTMLVPNWQLEIQADRPPEIQRNRLLWMSSDPLGD